MVAVGDYSAAGDASFELTRKTWAYTSPKTIEDTDSGDGTYVGTTSGVKRYKVLEWWTEDWIIGVS